MHCANSAAVTWPLLYNSKLCALLEPGFFELKTPLISNAISPKNFLFGFYCQNVPGFDETIGKGEKDDAGDTFLPSKWTKMGTSF